MPAPVEVIRSVLRPPLRDRRFWIVQGLVVLVAALHVFADVRLQVPPLGIPQFATVTLFLVPIVYAALNFGLSGSLATAAWVTVLTLPDLLFWDGREDRWDDSLQLAVIVAVAVFVGQRVERERLARHEAELAEARTKEYAQRALSAHEEERRRIAHELHDDPLQSLIHLGRRLEMLAEDPRLASAVQPEVAEVQAVATATAVRLREIARGLRPPSLDDLGLAPAVRQLVESARGGGGKTVDLKVSGLPRRLSPETELGLYRIAQEALTNVERHAGAQHVKVALAFQPDAVSLAVSDDGQGFDSRSPDRSLGLPGMRERAALLGGRLRVRSVPGQGTVIRAMVPAASGPTA